MSTKALAFLDDVPAEFDFVEGIDGHSHVARIADGQDFLRDLSAYRESTDQRFTPSPKLRKVKGKHLPSREVVLERIAKVIRGFTVVQMPEGFGKSAIVMDLIATGHRVVFVSKTNGQLAEQQESFQARWNERMANDREYRELWRHMHEHDLRMHRRVSKGRNLQEVVHDTLGFWFEPTFHEPRSPYAAGVIDEPTTRQNLRAALDANGYQSIDHHALFDRLYVTYRPERIIGKNVDIILLTLTMYQGLCTARHMPWWNKLGLLSGRKRVYQEDTDGEFRRVGEVPSEQEVPKKTEWNGKQKTAEIGLSNIVVVIDDPSMKDFDFRRIVDDEKAVDLHHTYSQVSERERQKRFVKHWLDLGYPPLVAEQVAAECEREQAAHDIERSKDHYFEARPMPQHIGYGLQRGYARPNKKAGMTALQVAPPSIVVMTTEHITTALAAETFKRVRHGAPHVISYRDATNITSNVEIKSRAKGFRDVYLSTEASHVSGDCHLTVLATRLVRRSHKALLLLIYMALAEEFPGEDLTFIGDSLGLDLNLTNNRGRNDLADKATMIKLSVPNAEVAKHLWAQFQGSEKPHTLNTILLADLANQAIGRNQGYRWKGKPCVVLVDPMYANRLMGSGLIRYRTTPWGLGSKPGVAMHGPITALEQRLMHFLQPTNAVNQLGMSIRGFQFGAQMTDAQWAIYEEWLDRNNVVVPTVLRRS